MTKTAAIQIADTLKKTLGKSWDVQVFENFGWNVQANRGLLSLLAHHSEGSGKTTYSCCMARDSKYKNSDLPLWGSESGMTQKIYTDPKEAIAAKVRIAKSVVDALNEVVKDATDIVKEFKCDCCGKSYEV